MKKKLVTALVTMATMAVLLCGCGDKKPEAATTQEPETGITVEAIPEEVKEEEPVEEEVVEEVIEDVLPEGMYRSELTNLPIDESLKNQRPIACMVDNESLALPHYGISEADVVYELMNSTLNGRITRFMCLFKDWGAIEQVGSIRSTRPTNILLAAEWDAVLVHDGGPFYNDAFFAEEWGKSHFSGGFSRVKNGKSTEYTEYVMTGDLDKKFAASNIDTEYTKFHTDGPHYQFALPTQPVVLSDGYGASAKTAKDVYFPFPHNKSELHYNEDTQEYEYSEYGDVHKDAEDNAVLSFKNVLIQKCDFNQLDEHGYLIFNCINASGLEGYYLTNGQAIKVTWFKTDVSSPTQYFDEAGNEITINTGKTYVGFVPDDNWSDLDIK